MYVLRTDSRMPVQVKEINVYPDPVILKKGAKITISGKFTVNNEVGEHYTLDVSIKKKGFWGIWLPVPCFGNWYGTRIEPLINTDDL